ncbi:substrate-binding domain-containing protein [Martelella mediterranea]|uniref:substrate-binding domain-containing protein n=1 Tax=Martelella mediterranea TaxID=293089 RepID=UPI001E28D7BA|nr:substrate-binding domain-containing protein [Martelella mediterranea]MCD1635799.1 substrate-binding domain-containing protein [Martelella mediterranea]
MKATIISAFIAAAIGGAFGAPASAKDLTIGVMLLNGDTYFSNVVKGVQDANSDGNTIIVNYNGDAAKESRGFDDLITRQVDAIITSPLNPDSSVSAIRRAAQAGIDVICYNTCLNEDAQKQYVKAFVLSDQAGLGRATGEYAARYIKENIGDSITMGILTCDSFEICRQRRDAFFKVLDDEGISVDLVADQEAYVVDKAVPVAENILTANPDVDALWAANDGGTVGLVKAVQNAGRAGEIPVFGTDMTPQLGQMLLAEPHTLLTTTGQDGLATGRTAVEVVKKLDAGEDIGSFDQIVPVSNFTADDPKAVESYLKDNG